MSDLDKGNLPGSAASTDDKPLIPANPSSSRLAGLEPAPRPAEPEPVIDLEDEEDPFGAPIESLEGSGGDSAVSPGLAPELPATGSAALRQTTIHHLLQEAIVKGASDVHLTRGVPPIFRIDGSLRVSDHPPLTGDSLKRMIYKILIDEQVKEFEKKWELDCSTEIAGIGRFRVNIHKQRGNVEGAFRIVNDTIKPLKELGVPKVVEELARRQNGLLLLTGPTGAGKTTTMAALIDQINHERRCMIITIEDPIEYIHKPHKSVIKQREVHADTQSFGNALRHVLRQDPDVICIGEMRDLETISTALTAAETGHLVITTLHTPDATQTIDRIIDVFPPHQQTQIRVQLSSCLIGIVAQQLLAVPGESGRVPAIEVMIATPAIRKIIRTAKHEQLMSIIQTSSDTGMVSMDKSLKNLYQLGMISYDDAKNRARFPESFDAI